MESIVAVKTRLAHATTLARGRGPSPIQFGPWAVIVVAGKFPSAALPPEDQYIRTLPSLNGLPTSTVWHSDAARWEDSIPSLYNRTRSTSAESGRPQPVETPIHNASNRRYNICLLEIAAFVQERLACRFGQRVAKAIAEVQPGAMTTFSEFGERFAG